MNVNILFKKNEFEELQKFLFSKNISWLTSGYKILKNIERNALRINSDNYVVYIDKEYKIHVCPNNELEFTTFKKLCRDLKIKKLL